MIMIAEQSNATNADLVQIATDFFAPHSPLDTAEKHGGRPYEFRPQQRGMAAAVAQALAANRNLCVEAPTGVGKSFAYLVPAIHHALNSPHPVLITTETINLQEQLMEKDIPILREILGLEFKAALAKGRGNYLCQRRLRILGGADRDALLPMKSMASAVDSLAAWSHETEDGSRSDVDFRVDDSLWTLVCCETGNCANAKCAYFRRCFYWRARRKWDKAHLIVANHALFFTDLKIRKLEKLVDTVLPTYGAVVFDEAHTLEDSAANHLGLRLSGGGLSYTLRRLFDPKRAKGMLLRSGEDALELRKDVATVEERTDRFFERVREVLETTTNDSLLRIRKPDFVPDLISQPLAALSKRLRDYSKTIEDDDVRLELESQIDKCDGYRAGVRDFLSMAMDDHVYWVESTASGGGSVILQSAPVNVDELLGAILFNGESPVILTSATLTVNQCLNYYRRRTGYAAGDELVLDSPFDFEKQVRTYVPNSMPMPDERGYAEALAEQIKRFVQMTHGKAFVLFTSYFMLRRCADTLAPFFEDQGITLLAQGGDMTRTAMLREFRDDVDSVIFGTTSFWTGVDVPGEALSNVIITKLPFSVPSHPLIEGRIEKLKRQGGNAFMDYSLPEAVLKLRQGVGRLIRGRNDTGIIVILDQRVVKKRYGRHFLDSIPKCPVEFV